MSYFVESSISTVDWRAASSRGGESETQGSASWRGDHTFSSKVAGFSLRNFIEPEIESANPHLSKHEIQSLALKKFEQRLKQDLSFEHQETSHQDSTVYWTVIEGKNGKKNLLPSMETSSSHFHNFGNTQRIRAAHRKSTRV